MSENFTDMDAFTKIVNDAHNQKEISQINNQNNSQSKSHTTSKQSQKRNHFFGYQLPSFLVAATISITSAAVTNGIFKLKNNIQNNKNEKQMKNYIEQIYNADEENERRNALNKNKYKVPGVDIYGHPLWAVDYYKVVKEFLQLPDETVNSNIYTFYLYFNNDYANFDDFINELSKIIEGVKDNYPYTYELVSGCNTFEDFLEKNYRKYQIGDESLKDTFERMNTEHYSIIDLPELEEEARGMK